MAEKGGKIVLDPIYGMIELDSLAVKIIDTHYFQRLRYIKQLSFADFVYPGATHTRFAHSIGVYHLACEMIKRIKSQELEDVGLTDKEERCIRVAALCHDMGHGPFSHAYENIFEKELQGVKHEHISEFLVERMFKDNDNFRLEKNEFDIGLIQALIQGNYEKYENDPNMTAKKYIFQIVSNKTSGMDVDKWDYFNRDAIACGVPERFQFGRALQVVRVVNVQGKYELGYRDHDAFSFYNMYNTRFTLHRKVYRHRVVVAVELMVKDVFQLVSEANETSAKSEKGVKDVFQRESEANETSAKSEKGLTIDLCPAKALPKGEQVKNMLLRSNDGSNTDNKYLMIEDYLKLRDDVLLKIQDSKDERYQNAQTLIKRIHTRKLYKLIKEFKVNETKDKESQTDATLHQDKESQTDATLHQMQNDLKRWLEEHGRKDEFKSKMQEYLQKEIDDAQRLKNEVKLKMQEYLQKEIDEGRSLKNEVKLKMETFNYGKKAEDPVEKMYFYRKGQMDKPETLERKEVSFVLPNIFQEHYIRVYEKFSENTDYTEEKKSQLKTGLGIVFNKFEEKYQGNLVMKRKQDVPAERVTSTPSMSTMSNVNKEDLSDSKE